MLLAVALDTVLTVAAVAAASALVIGVFLALFVKWVMAKVVLLGLFVLLAWGVWSQRDTVRDCVDRAQASSGQVTCSFFGAHLDVPVP